MKEWSIDADGHARSRHVGWLQRTHRLFVWAAFSLLATAPSAQAQVADMESATNAALAGSGPTGNGPTQAAETITLRRNGDNPTGSNFVATAQPLTMTFSWSNLQFTATEDANYVAFGAAPNFGTNPAAAPIYSGLNGIDAPLNSYYTAAGGAAAGTGIDVARNGGIRVFVSSGPLARSSLWGTDTDARVHMADLTLTFNRPVTNPILHINGLGSDSTAIIGFGRQGYTQEYEVLTTGVSLTRLSGNDAAFAVGAGTVDGHDYGDNWIHHGLADVSQDCSVAASTIRHAACGSVRVNGTDLTTLVLRVHLRGDGSAARWQSNVNNEQGDVVTIGVSVDLTTVTATKVMNGANGSFNFSGTNGIAAHTITTTNPGTGVAGAEQVLTMGGVATTLTEAAPPSGFVLSGINCTGMGDGGIATPSINGVGGGSVTLDAAATAYGRRIACTFTNDLPPAPPAFSGCTADLYLSQYNPMALTGPATLYQVAASTNPMTYSALGAAANLTYNASAYNHADNLIYAITHSQGAPPNNLNYDLVRVGSNGQVQNLGPVSGLPAPADGSANPVPSPYVAGVIGSDGFYYVLPSAAGNQMQRINLATLTATSVTLSRSISVGDLAWSGGSLYGHEASTGQFFSIGTTGTVTNIGAPISTGGQAFGVMYGVSNGVWGMRNDGDLYRFDLVTGVATKVAESPPASGNDGAVCVNSSLDFPTDTTVSKTDGQTAYQAPQALTYTVVVRNTGPFGMHNAVVTDALPTGITTATWTCGAATGGGVCHAASGSAAGGNIINGAIVDLPYDPGPPALASSVTFTVTMTVPAGRTGDLVNTVSVVSPSGSSDPTLANNTATDTNTQRSADLAIAKTNTPGNGPVDAPDDVVIAGVTTYDIVVSNAGPDTVVDAIVRDPVSANPNGCVLGAPACVITTGTATCPTVGAGSGQLSVANLQNVAAAGGVRIPSMDAASSLTFKLACTVN